MTRTRTRTRTTLGALATSATICLAPLTPALAQQGGENEPKVLMGFSHAGFDALLHHEHDQGLKQALRMVMPRFMELRNADTPFAENLRDIPEPVLGTVSTLMGAPMTMVVTGGTFDPNTGTPIFEALVSFDVEDERAARQVHDTVIMATNEGGGELGFQPSDRFDGMTELVTPVGPVSFGPRDADDGWRYEIVLGANANPDTLRTLLPDAPRGRQLASGVLDFEALTPFSQMGVGFLQMASPQGAQIAKQFRDSGIIGEGAMRIEFTSSTDGATNTSRTITRRAKNFRSAMYLPESTLTRADLAIIPADATAAVITKFDPATFIDAMIEQGMMGTTDRDAARAQLDEVLAEIREMTGVDVMNELVPALGDTVAAYFSDSTGGGSPLSGVVAIKAADKDALRRVITKLQDAAVRETQRGPMGGAFGLRTLRDTHNGNPVITSRIAGLPIPLAPSMTIVDDWFVFGLSHQAAAAAAELTGERAGNGLLDNPRFTEAYDHNAQTVSVAFVDSARTLRDGVTTMNLLGMALGNVVTSPDPDSPALMRVVPSMVELNDDPHPIIQHRYWSDDDLVQIDTSDASMVSTLTAMLGIGDAAPLIGGLILGAGGGAAALEADMGSMRGGDDWDDDDWDDDWDDTDDDPDY